MLRTLYKEDDRFVETYWDKFGKETYLVGDAARRDEDGYIWIIGRIDDVVNVSGHRLSTAEVESAIVSHGKVAEAAVIGQADEDTGQAITAFVTLEGDLEGTDELIDEIREKVASRIGKFARPKRIIWADDLPKTRSGKIMRRLLRDIAEGRELGDVTTLRDPDVMQQLEGKIKERDAEEGVVSRWSPWRDRSSRHSHRPSIPRWDPVCVRVRSPRKPFEARRDAMADWEGIERSDEFRELGRNAGGASSCPRRSSSSRTTWRSSSSRATPRTSWASRSTRG